MNESRTCAGAGAELTQARSRGVHEWTYFIAGADAIKIGRSKQPRGRMADLQFANGSELELLLAVPSSRLSEPDAHRKFKHLRLRGEWFRPTKELLDFIEALRIETKKPIQPARPRQTEWDRIARNLYRAMPTMPKPARPFAYNLIELIRGDVMNAPRMGDHPLQDPKRFLRVQLERFEEAMKAA